QLLYDYLDKPGHRSWKTHRKVQKIWSLPHEENYSLYWAVVLGQERARSQPIGACWCPELDNPLASVGQNVPWIRFKHAFAVRHIERVHHFQSKCPVCRKHTGDRLSDGNAS